jgi:hypothetical protein
MFHHKISSQSTKNTEKEERKREREREREIESVRKKEKRRIKRRIQLEPFQYFIYIAYFCEGMEDQLIVC